MSKRRVPKTARRPWCWDGTAIGKAAGPRPGVLGAELQCPHGPSGQTLFGNGVFVHGIQVRNEVILN